MVLGAGIDAFARSIYMPSSYAFEIVAHYYERAEACGKRVTCLPSAIAG
jgi:hypothetical protein